MSLFFVRQDITKMKVDAIVNAANNSLLGGGGVDGAIHRAAGPGLKNECAKLNGCGTGEVKITGGYDLPCKKVIHTVGPVWKGGQFGEALLLRSCYRKSLELAKENGLASIAFPLISSGAYGYPKDQALSIAVTAIREFLNEEDMDVYLVIFDRESFAVSKRLCDEVREYVDNNYVEKEVVLGNRSRGGWYDVSCEPLFDAIEYSPNCCKKATLEEVLDNLDESFSEMLFRLIDEKGMTDVECYKKANVDRKVFSKIRNTKVYRPSKTTAVAFAIALELPLDRAKRLIELAGYSLTHNNKFDVIIEYFIKAKKYDIFEINEVLFEFDQKLLGC